jgi:hypothetical protein
MFRIDAGENDDRGPALPIRGSALTLVFRTESSWSQNDTVQTLSIHLANFST